MAGDREAENERRARLYDALWDAAYITGGIRLMVVGGHDTIDRIETRNEIIEGMSAIEQWLTDKPWRA